ncbi:hypothetical protein Tco_0832043 [Tanacetum coccineum]
MSIRTESWCGGDGGALKDSSMVDGILVGVFGGLGDYGVNIGDGILAMGEFGGEAIGEFGGEGVTKSTKFKCLTLILVVFLRVLVEEEFEEAINV